MKTKYDRIFKNKRLFLRLARRLMGVLILLHFAGCASPPPAPDIDPVVPASQAEWKDPPLVMVVLTEKNSAGAEVADAGTVALMYLMDHRIPVVDQAVVLKNKEKIQAVLSSAGDDQGVAAVGMYFGADVIIYGEAEARQTAQGIRGSKLNSYQGTVTMRAVYTDDGKILATASGSVPVIAMDDVSGSSRALRSAAEQVTQKLIADLRKVWEIRVADSRSGRAGATGASAMSLSAIFRDQNDEVDIVTPAPPRGHKPEVTALWGLTPQAGVQPEWMGPLTETLYTVLLQSGWFRLVSREDMGKIMAEHNIQLSDICDTAEQAVEFGKIMSARKMVIGTVSKLGGTYQVTLRLVDVESGEIEKAGRAEGRGAMDVLFRLVRLAGVDLLR